MRNHILTKMTGDELEAYLDRGGDTIFIAMGVVECHGNLPIDCETIGPEAYAVALAEKYDAVAMIDLPFFYPGGTVVSNATVHISIRHSIEWLEQVCLSLIDQGFKKLFIISGHAPSVITINAFARDFFEKYKIHPVHLSGMALQAKAFGGDRANMPEDAKYVTYGQYKYMGQMDYIPITPNAKSGTAERKATEPALAAFSKAVGEFGGFASIIYSNPNEHGGGLVITSEEERLEICTKGEKAFLEGIEKIDLSNLIKTLGDYQDYVQSMVEKFPRLKELGKI